MWGGSWLRGWWKGALGWVHWQLEEVLQVDRGGKWVYREVGRGDGAPCQPVCSPVSWSIPSSEEFSSQKSRCLLSFPIDLAPCPVYAPPKQHSVYICFSKIPLSPPGSSHQYFLDFFQQPPGGSCFYSSTIIFKYITVQPLASLKYLNHKCCTPI